MKKVIIKDALVAGWEAFMRRPWYLLGLTLAFSGLVVVAVGNQIITAFAAVLYGGFLMMFIRHFHGEHIVFDDMFAVQDRWVQFAGLMLIKSFFILLGFLCFIIPGIYLSVRWMFAEWLVVDQKMMPLEALRESGKLTQGVRWKLFWMLVVIMLLVFVGFFFFIIGAFIMGIVATFMYIKVYEDLKKATQEESLQEKLPHMDTGSDTKKVA